MKEQKATEKTILCDCGHPISSHASGLGQCYASTRKTERRKNHLGKYVKVKCCYVCACGKFTSPELSELDNWVKKQ